MRWRNLFTLSVLMVILAGCGPSGCQALGPLMDPSRGALSSTQFDEVALAGVKATGTILNKTYALAARSEPPLMTKARDDQVFGLLADYDGLVQGAEAAYNLGDAAGYLDKIRAAQALADKIGALIPAPKAK